MNHQIVAGETSGEKRAEMRKKRELRKRREEKNRLIGRSSN